MPWLPCLKPILAADALAGSGRLGGFLGQVLGQVLRQVRTWGRGLRPLLRQEPLPPRPVVVLAAAIVAGAAAGPCCPGIVTATAALPCWSAAVLAAAAGWWARWRGRDRAAAVAVVAAACCGAAAWSAARFDLFDRRDLAWQLSAEPTPVAVRATVETPPQRLSPPVTDARRSAAIGPASECVVLVREIRDGRRWRPAAGRAAVIVRGDPVELPAGSRLQIFGRGLRPTAALNPGEFDVALRARAERCLSIVRVDSWDCIELVAAAPVWSPRAWIDRLRCRAGRVLAAGISAEREPLAAALLLGNRGSLPRAAADDFVATGTIHVLAISGLHVGLLAAGLFAALRHLLVPRAWAVVAVVAATGLYAVLVGGGTPVVRATLLVWTACLAAAAGRRPAAITSLAAAAIVLVAWRPADVLTPGAQLSFLSTAVLVGAAAATRPTRRLDPIERLVERSRPRWERVGRRAAAGLAAVAVSGAAVWLASAPLVAARFHVVSPVAVVANILIAPLVPLAMACGLLCLLSAAVSGVVAAAFAAGCDASLAVIAAVISRAAAVPLGHAWVTGAAGWWVAGWYALLAAAVLGLRRELLVRPACWATLAGGWAGVGLVAGALAAATAPAAPGLRVVLTAVGHGCGIVVRAPTGRCLLYDAGRLGSPAAALRAVSGVLWSEGIDRLETLVISHADADHFNAVPELLERFSIGEILVPEAFLASEAAGVADLLAAAAARGVPVRTARAGDSFAVDPLCRVRVLHPRVATAAEPVRDMPADDNASSLVLAVETAGRRVLITGDLEGRPLASFAASSPGECDVLVAPHHGSQTSLPAEIARVTNPGLVLVSGRGGRAWPTVSEAYATAAGGPPARVLKTGGEGAVAATLTAAGIEVERFRAGRWRPLPAADDQAAAVRGGLVSSHPAASRKSWLATYAPSSSSTPLVNP